LQPPRRGARSEARRPAQFTSSSPYRRRGGRASYRAGGRVHGPLGLGPIDLDRCHPPSAGGTDREIVTSLRRGDLGLDIVAALSMTAALVFGQELAAAVVALMCSGGQYLELFAECRARREITVLLERVPRAAMRHRDGGLEEVPLGAIAPGDRLLIRQGDVVPVDGNLIEGVAVLDET
jgi:hypothetical protein